MCRQRRAQLRLAQLATTSPGTSTRGQVAGVIADTDIAQAAFAEKLLGASIIDSRSGVTASP